MHQVQLPFNPFQLQMQPMMFAQDTPPIVVNLTDINPKIAYLLRNVCSEVINEVNRKAGSNVLRTFHFNQIYNNGFNNQDYFQLVQSTMDIMEFLLVNGHAATPEQAMAVAVPRATLFSCVMNLQNPQFRQSLVGITDPRQVHESDQLMQEINSIQSAIMRYKQANYGGMQAPAFINHSGVNYQNQQWNQNPQYGNPPPPQNNAFSRFPSAASPVNNQHLQQNINQRTYVQKPFQPVNVAQQQPESNVATDGKYGYLAKAKNVQISVVPQQNHQFQQPQIIEVKEDDDGFDLETKWIPSEEYPYPYAVNKKEKLRSRTISKTRVLDNGEIETVNITQMIVQPRSIEDMNRDQHTIVTTSQMAVTSFIPPAFDTRQQAVDNALTNTISEAKKESSKLTTKVKTSEGWSAHMFLEKHIFENRLMHSAHVQAEECAAYRSYHILTKPFISKRNNDDVVADLAQSSTINQLVRKMQERLRGNVDKHIVGFINELDVYLTDEFKKYLGGKFCIYIKKLDSFMDDCENIYSFILSQSTEAHLSAFKRHEKAFIKSFISSIQCEELKASLIDECTVTAEDDKTPLTNVTFVESTYSITSVDIHSSELNVELYKATPDEGKGRSSLIMQSSNPALFKFAKDLIAETKEQGDHFAHHLMITSDNQIFEIHNGVIGFQENYLISEFPN